MQLKKIQELFVTTVGTNNSIQELMDIILPCGSLTKQEALDIYVSDYKARMLEALGKNYEATWLILGDDDFFSHSEDYIFSNPSNLTSLTSYGYHFPDFLKLKGVPLEVYQMAIFERCFWRLFHAPFNPLLILTKDNLETIHFDLSDILLLESNLRLDLVWQCREDGEDALSEVDVYEECHLALFKAYEKVEIKVLSSEAYALLLELSKIGIISEMNFVENEPGIWAEALDVIKFSTIRPQDL